MCTILSPGLSMENTSNRMHSRRGIFYYRKRLKNRIFSQLAAFFAKEAERNNITKKEIASRLDRDPAQITRWLSAPSNLTLETLSDLLYAMDAEAEPPKFVRFADRAKPNFAHPLIADVLGSAPQTSGPILSIPIMGEDTKETKTTAEKPTLIASFSATSKPNRAA